MKYFKKATAILMTAILATSLVACSKPAETPVTPVTTETGDAETPAVEAEKPNDDILIIGVGAAFEEKWNPFLSENAYDMQVMNQIFTPIVEVNAENELVPRGGTVTAENTPDGGALYTITVNQGMTFSDGAPVTIDDYIYGLYVKADPSYTGPGALIGSKIEGLDEYYYDDAEYSAKLDEIAGLVETKYAADKISFEDFLEYAKATKLEGWWSGDPAGDIGDGTTWSDYIKKEGFEADLAAIDATNADAMFDIVAKVEYTNYLDGYTATDWWDAKLKEDYALGSIAEGVSVPEITGIKRVDDFTCTVKYTEIDIYADRGLGDENGAGHIAPKHYYGEFQKGDVSKILANMVPLGSGPYVWGGFADNIVTATANPTYFEGVPKTGTVRWQYIPEADVLESIASGKADIVNPTGNKQNVEEMQKLGIRFDLIDNAGYGYLAMNTERVPLDVRKGIWSLMNRAPSVEGYYGPDIAKVIERPMTTVLAEYPQEATQYYEYSREKALEYFNAAGYTQKDGQLVDENGKKLVINVFIGGSGQGAHPGYAMLVQAAADMEALGAELQIQDVEFNVLQGAMNDGTADMWVMAWGAVNSCDKSTQFRSTGGQNKYKFKDAKMDEMLDKIIQTINLDERRVLVSEMLDYAMENCIELPLYQRKNILAYNEQNLNMDTIPAATAFYNYERVLWKVEMAH